jgi:hypothetical protein
MRVPDLVFRQARKSLQEQRADFIGPEQVHDFLVRENGVGGRADAAHQNDENKSHNAD